MSSKILKISILNKLKKANETELSITLLYFFITISLLLSIISKMIFSLFIIHNIILEYEFITIKIGKILCY